MAFPQFLLHSLPRLSLVVVKWTYTRRKISLRIACSSHFLRLGSFSSFSPSSPSFPLFSFPCLVLLFLLLLCVLLLVPFFSFAVFSLCPSPSPLRSSPDSFSSLAFFSSPSPPLRFLLVSFSSSAFSSSPSPPLSSSLRFYLLCVLLFRPRVLRCCCFFLPPPPLLVLQKIAPLGTYVFSSRVRWNPSAGIFTALQDVHY